MRILLTDCARTFFPGQFPRIAAVASPSCRQPFSEVCTLATDRLLLGFEVELPGQVESSQCARARLCRARQSGAESAIAAHSSASGSTAPSSTARFTRPIRSASAPSRILPVKRRSAAWAGPTIRGRVQVAPMPGWMPRRVKLRPSLALERRSGCRGRAMQNPAPMAAPSRRRWSDVQAAQARYSRRNGASTRRLTPGIVSGLRIPPGHALDPRRSPPAEKTRPAPVITTARRMASPASASICSAMAWHRLGHRVPALGSLKVTIATSRRAPGDEGLGHGIEASPSPFGSATVRRRLLSP